MRKVRPALEHARATRILAVALACLACAGVAWIAGVGRTSDSELEVDLSCTPDRYPVLCSHRIVGDEVDLLSWQPVRAMSKLFKHGIYCFDADVIR